MAANKNVVVASVVLIPEIAAGCYVALIVWLVSVWMVDDSVAIRMGSAVWYLEAGRRMLIGGVAGSVFGALTHLVNRRVVVRVFPEPPLARRVPVVLATCIALTGVVGAFHFAVTKPFM